MKLDHLILRSKRKIIDDNLASVLIVIEVIKIYVCVCKDYAILTKQSNVCWKGKNWGCVTDFGKQEN